ncbi:putative reverse transcriptase domain-containing protein, partial [Tanacetum coccineum]
MVDFVPGRAVIDVAQRKRDKYMAKCAAIGYEFLHFSLSSLEELEADAVTLLKRIRKFSVAHDIGTRGDVHIFNRIVVPVIVLMLTTNCLRCDLYQVKGFELVVVSSHACLAAVALLCLSHNLRKYGVRKFLFVDQYHG